MSEPVAAQQTPCEVELEAGTWWWCACGLSRNQPFCDGSHADSGITPVELKVTEKATFWLCGCKATKTAPHCDGTHNKL